jgi:DNA-binding MarR family transcriptional regulator
VKRELLPLRLTFAQWLVLQTMAELIAETRDAVSELAVATRLGMDRTTVSQVTWRLAWDGFVNAGPSAVWPALRSRLTERGQRMAREGAALVEAASLAWLAERRREAA